MKHRRGVPQRRSAQQRRRADLLMNSIAEPTLCEPLHRLGRRHVEQPLRRPSLPDGPIFRPKKLFESEQSQDSNLGYSTVECSASSEKLVLLSWELPSLHSIVCAQGEKV
jgi:hypothetical protein